MTPMELGDLVRQAVGGSVALALPVAFLAGLVSFFSPCVLPLVPAYLSYATGMSARRSPPVRPPAPVTAAACSSGRWSWADCRCVCRHWRVDGSVGAALIARSVR